MISSSFNIPRFNTLLFNNSPKLLPIVTSTPTYMNMANIQMQTNNIPAAIESYKKPLKIKPKMATIHLSLGMIYYQFRKDIPKALGYLKECFRLNPNQPGAAKIKALIADLENKQSA